MNKFKIPTLLGLSIIFAGIIIGVYLTLKEQIFLSQASPNVTLQNITLSNITENSAVISWQTDSAVTSFVAFGQNSSEQTALDDKDDNTPKPHLIHYVTLKNLLPKTTYKFKIIAGKLTSDVKEFQTAQPLINQTSFPPVIGSVLVDIPVIEGIAYLSIPGAIIQSAQIKTGGHFLIPLSNIRKNDQTDFQLTEGTIAKLTIYTDQGETSALFNLKANSAPLPPIKLGQNIDLTNAEETPPPSPTTLDLDQYDLNGDGKINAADNAIILQNFGKKSKNLKADLNKDGTVNQEDLDLMAQKLKD